MWSETFMHHLCYPLWIGCLLIVMGCSPRDESYEGQRTSFKALAQAYEEAHTRKDIDALLELVYVGNGPIAEVNRRTFRAHFDRDLQKNLRRIHRKRLTRDDREFLSYPNLGMRTAKYTFFFTLISA